VEVGSAKSKCASRIPAEPAVCGNPSYVTVIDTDTLVCVSWLSSREEWADGWMGGWVVYEAYEVEKKGENYAVFYFAGNVITWEK
jgi:hypothetical protein